MLVPRRLVLLAFASTLALAAPALAQDAPPPAPARVSVTGEGWTSRAPDLALVRLTVLRAAPTAAAALGEANTAMTAVTAAMPAFGVAPRDLQTGGFQISPQYRYENRSDGTQAPPTLTGYEVRNTLNVRVRDLTKIGEVLDKAVQLGVNEGGSIDFQVEDNAAASNEARRDAVAKARASAEALADAAGLKLGRVVTLEDGAPNFAPPMPMMDMRAMAAPAPANSKVPVEIGETTISAQVRIVYELTP